MCSCSCSNCNRQEKRKSSSRTRVVRMSPGAADAVFRGRPTRLGPRLELSRPPTLLPAQLFKEFACPCTAAAENRQVATHRATQAGMMMRGAERVQKGRRSRVGKYGGRKRPLCTHSRCSLDDDLGLPRRTRQGRRASASGGKRWAMKCLISLYFQLDAPRRAFRGQRLLSDHHAHRVR